MSVKRSRAGAKMHRRRTLTAYLFIAPNFIGYLVLTFVPIVLSFVYSLYDWNLGVNKDFVGLDNYIYMFIKCYLYFK